MQPPPLNPNGRLLMGPGPSNVAPRVYEALAKPLVGHLDPQFLTLMNEVQELLRHVFRTRNRVTLAVSGTGSAGMEAAFVNSVEPSDEVLVCANGVFGGRMADIVGRIGGVLRRIDRPWGEVFAPDEVEEALRRHPRTKVVAIVHAETSTGAQQPLREIGRLCRESGRLFLVDCVTSLGGLPVDVDAWEIDIAYSGTQKCLSCPPGLAPLTFGERALEKLFSRKTKVASWYLDLSMIVNYWTEGKRAYHHTAPISMNYALHQALALVVEEGLEPRWRRHELNGRALAAGIEALGFRPFASEGRRLPVLQSVWIPSGLEDGPARRKLLEEHGIEVGAGLGEVAGKIWRVGLMGHTSRRENVMRFLAALEELIRGAGLSRSMGRGLEAAAEVYGSGGSGGGPH
jgi:alanine-glyoxylate transaminase/serine-glyoxylate transaminase/serine-pyruvate transaminase